MIVVCCCGEAVTYHFILLPNKIAKGRILPKSSVTNNARNKIKTDGKVVTDLSFISHETKRKEADAPVYLLRYDD